MTRGFDETFPSEKSVVFDEHAFFYFQVFVMWRMLSEQHATALPHHSQASQLVSISLGARTIAERRIIESEPVANSNNMCVTAVVFQSSNTTR